MFLLIPNLCFFAIFLRDFFSALCLWGPVFYFALCLLTLVILLVLVPFRRPKKPSAGRILYRLRQATDIISRSFNEVTPDPEEDPRLTYLKNLMRVAIVRALFYRNPYAFIPQPLETPVQKIMYFLTVFLQNYTLAVAVI